jgi:hypothetical protein
MFITSLFAKAKKKGNNLCVHHLRAFDESNYKDGGAYSREWGTRRGDVLVGKMKNVLILDAWHF